MKARERLRVLPRLLETLDGLRRAEAKLPLLLDPLPQWHEVEVHVLGFAHVPPFFVESGLGAPFALVKLRVGLLLRLEELSFLLRVQTLEPRAKRRVPFHPLRVPIIG